MTVALISHLGSTILGFEISNGTTSSHATVLARAASAMQMSYTNKPLPVTTTCRQFSCSVHKNWNAFKCLNALKEKEGKQYISRLVFYKIGCNKHNKSPGHGPAYGYC